MEGSSVVSNLDFLLLHAKQVSTVGGEPSLNSLWSLLSLNSQELRDDLIKKASIDMVWHRAGQIAKALAQLADLYEEEYEPKRKKK